MRRLRRTTRATTGSQKFTLTGDFVTQWGSHRRRCGARRGCLSGGPRHRLSRQHGLRRRRRQRPDREIHQRGRPPQEWGAPKAAAGQFQARAESRRTPKTMSTSPTRQRPGAEILPNPVSSWMNREKPGPAQGELELPSGVAADAAGGSSSPIPATTGSSSSTAPAPCSRYGVRKAKAPGNSSCRSGSLPARLGKVFIADAGNDRIQVFAPDLTGPAPILPAGGLPAPLYGKASTSADQRRRQHQAAGHREIRRSHVRRHADPGRHDHRRQTGPTAAVLGQRPRRRDPDRRLLLRQLQGAAAEGRQAGHRAETRKPAGLRQKGAI